MKCRRSHVRAGRDPLHPPERPRKGLVRLEAAVQRDIQDGLFGGAEQFAGIEDPPVPYIRGQGLPDDFNRKVRTIAPDWEALERADTEAAYQQAEQALKEATAAAAKPLDHPHSSTDRPVP